MTWVDRDREQSWILGLDSHHRDASRGAARTPGQLPSVLSQTAARREWQQLAGRALAAPVVSGHWQWPLGMRGVRVRRHLPRSGHRCTGCRSRRSLRSPTRGPGVSRAEAIRTAIALLPSDVLLCRLTSRLSKGILEQILRLSVLGPACKEPEGRRCVPVTRRKRAGRQSQQLFLDLSEREAAGLTTARKLQSRQAKEKPRLGGGPSLGTPGGEGPELCPEL